MIALLLATGLLACGSSPPAPDAAVAPPAAAVTAASLPSAAASAFERQQRERALQQTRQGSLADAALAWELLALVRPDVPDYRERLAETRRQIDAAVAERLPRAAAAYRRGELEAAAQQYLAVLALQPDQAQAADALRAIERDRNRRYYLGRPSRLTLTRRAVADGEMTPKPASFAERNDVEHASMLADQGEFDDAIALLERRAAADRHDRETRELLADVYCRKGEALVARDAAASIGAFERCQRLMPGDPRAGQRLRQLRAASPAVLRSDR